MSGISKIVTTMKKIMKPFVLVAVAAMALASCQKNEIPAPEKQDVHFTINAGIETKTSIVESEDKDENGKPIYHAQWDGNEELGVLFAAPDAETKDTDVVRLKNAESGSLASFQGTVTVDEPAGTFYAFYPAEAFKRGYMEGDSRLDLKNVQKPTATSFDPSCDILVAKPYDYEVVDGKVVADGLEFARLMSVLRIDLKSEFADIQNEFVESVSFTAGDVEITGYARIFLDNPKFDKWASNGAQWCSVTANYDSDLVSINGTSNSVYLVIAPVTIPANKDLTFEIKTKNYNISKTIKSPEMKFTAGKVSKINLTIAADNCDKIDTSIDYSGEYLIVNTDLTKAASKWANGNNLPAVNLESENGVVYVTDNLADCKMTITKETEGENAGKYTIQDAAGKYLYAAGGSGSNPSNHLKGSDSEYYWTIDKNGDKFTLISLSGATRNILRYNGTNNPPIFSCYGSGQSDVTLYKYSDLAPDTRQKLEITTATLNLESDASTGSIDVTAENLPSDLQVRALTAEDAQEEVNWLTVTYADGKITYTATANESEDARTAYIKAYVSDDLKDGVVVTQAGKVAENVPVQKSVTYTVESTSSVTVSGDALENASATYSSTYGTKCQLTANNSMTFTLSGYDGCTIEGVTLSMKSNSSKGAGNLSITVGSKIVSSISTAKFNSESWYGNWSTSYVDVKPAVTSSVVGNGEKIVVKIAATENSLYCQSITIDYLTASTGSEGGETPVEPAPDPEEPETPEQGESFTATFNFKQIYVDNGNAATSNVTIGAVTFIGDKGTGTTPARAWSDGLRLYAGSKVTFKAAEGYVITNISGHKTFAFTGSQQNVEFTGLTKATIADNIVVTYKKN